ncbi:hypothetical protein Tsubulata_040742 [Turnera subulata]|uniref:Peptidase A1 domain-containing protein n=1 Tax=Turnera subulata TaxID=218843 RepID=A0A9Q0FUY8_9ROSI|nr:hypothetical protein Tsubulata_040742 [Turnera subulata]
MSEIMLVLAIVVGLIFPTIPLGLINSTQDSLFQSEKIELFHITQLQHAYHMSLSSRLERDKRRVDTLSQTLAGEPSINVRVDLMSNPPEYVVRLGIGSPPIYQYMLIDMGTNLSWIQCQPCPKCYHQVSPIYDPKNSSTYQEVYCEDYASSVSKQRHLNWGWLQIGRDEAIPSGVAWTPMMHNLRTKHPLYYYVGLSGISVGRTKVPIPEPVFQLNRKGKGGVIVDTGIMITTFPEVAYNTFRDAFLAQMKQFSRTHGVGQLDTCFNIGSLPSLSLPNVSFHFTSGVILALTVKNILVQVDRSLSFVLPSLLHQTTFPSLAILLLKEFKSL